MLLKFGWCSNAQCNFMLDGQMTRGNFQLHSAQIVTLQFLFGLQLCDFVRLRDNARVPLGIVYMGSSAFGVSAIIRINAQGVPIPKEYNSDPYVISTCSLSLSLTQLENFLFVIKVLLKAMYLSNQCMIGTNNLFKVGILSFSNPKSKYSSRSLL